MSSAVPSVSGHSSIIVRGAREHNLKGIDVDIPRDKLVVVTGVSGSGKSTLAFDTVYAEGQRRYVESLSAYARQFLQQHNKPEVDSIEGLSPAIAIEQKSTAKNPRSTVGTLTEIYDYLRLLFARVGVPHCPSCRRPIAAQTVPRIVDSILELPTGTRFLVLAPVVRGKKGAFKRELARLRMKSFARVRVDGEMCDLGEDLVLDKNVKHTVDVVVDRLVCKEGMRQRLVDSVELALAAADGLLKVAVVGGEETLYSQRHACAECGISLPELQPRLFSFNSPHGACRTCEGLGVAMEMDPDKIIPDPGLSLPSGALAAPGYKNARYSQQQLQGLAEHFGVDVSVPWSDLPEDFRRAVLYGTGQQRIRFTYESEAHKWQSDRAYEGVVPTLLRRMKETPSERGREEYERFMTRRPCPGCAGTRLRPEAQAITVGGLSIVQVTAMSVTDAQRFFGDLRWGERDAAIARRVLREVQARLEFLGSVGLDYLSLDRASGSLSGGEAQRIRLATQIGSALRGVIYVLDEPSVGLHQRDNARLLQTLTHLRDLGNTVLVVEHDAEAIRAADYVIDMGPGAGVHGGDVVAAGSPDEIQASARSLTAQYLSGVRRIEAPAAVRPGDGRTLRIRGARGHNLKRIDVTIPLGQLVCVTGVSGSGKSTLVNDTLYPALANALHRSTLEVAPHDGVDGLECIDKVIAIDQSPIGRTPRSNPATYTQLFGPLRELFAGLPESRARGYKPGRYSFNVKGGRCEACEGDGELRIEMHFLPDVFVTCEQCHGRRYNPQTLEVLYKKRSIADVLDMTVDEAHEFFHVVGSIARKLETLQAVGLGYIKLGQAATTLSGGEAQRVKLSRELSRRATGRTLYILDEPTTGLHFHDVERLLQVLHALVDAGNTVVVIEHHLDVIKNADHVIDLGPEGGSRGGTVVTSGTPRQVSRVRQSFTGQYLARIL